MKLAILIQAFGRFGGAERAALEHYTCFKAAGKDVDLFADFTDKHVFAREELNNITFKPLPRTLADPDSIRLIQEFEEYDRILIHHHVEPVLAYRIVNRFASKTAWYSGSIFEPAYSDMLHGEDYRKVSLTFESTTKSFYGKVLGSLGLALFPFSKKVLRVIDYDTVTRYGKIISNSEYQARYIKSVYGRDSVIVYPPVESGLLSAKTIPIDIVDQPFVMMVGAFVPYKNFQAGIRAMAPLKHSYSLAIVGSGLLKKQYEQLARAMDVDLHIYYGANDSMMHSLYTAASFLIHPSLFEGFGFIPAEAALHQKATILTTRSGVKELLEDGRSSYFCDPTDVPLISKRATELAENPEAAREMGRRAYDSIHSLSEPSQSMAVWEELENWT